MSNIKIVSTKELSNQFIKKYGLVQQKKIRKNGYTLKRGKLKTSNTKNEYITLHVYTGSEDILNKIRISSYITLNGETAYFINASKKWIFSLIIILIVIVLSLLLIVRLESNSSTNPFDIVREKKIDNKVKDLGNIIYQGFPATFEVNRNIRVLSVQNDMTNKDKFYTGVKLIEDNEVIYDMQNKLIEPGKYVNIDLYDLLNSGDHDITIVQYGYYIGDTLTQVASESSQNILVSVNKE